MGVELMNITPFIHTKMYSFLFQTINNAEELVNSSYPILYMFEDAFEEISDLEALIRIMIEKSLTNE